MIKTIFCSTNSNGLAMYIIPGMSENPWIIDKIRKPKAFLCEIKSYIYVLNRIRIIAWQQFSLST